MKDIIVGLQPDTIRRFLFALGVIIITIPSQAQLHFNANIQNMHLWRGIEVADGVVLTTEVSVTDPKEHFRIGMWGGTNVEGNYKEFNYFASYTYKGFSLAFWDTYNFSPGATYNNKEFFNYKPGKTGRYLDAIASYRFSGKFPLLLSWSTVLFGRDRNTDNTANKYSTFCYAEYPVYQKEAWRVDAGIGGAFALNKAGDASTFYGDKPGIVHITLKVTRKVQIRKREFPIFACALWNPQSDSAFLQLGAQLFSF